jgi:hypothetical protein
MLNINQKYFDLLLRYDGDFKEMLKTPAAAGADRAFEIGRFPERPEVFPPLSITTIDTYRYSVEP